MMNESFSSSRSSSLARNQLSWKNVSLINPTDNKIILDNLNGTFQTGDFLSIMGPSGAGKSSLLSILSSRLRKNNTKLSIQGQTLLNGKKYNLEVFSKVSAFVQQEDILLGTLSVKQTFLFQAKLRLWDQSLQEQQNKCQALLKKLNLVECADTLIGNNQFRKSISGGQKKRVSIGVQLISDPQILIFDEPTSGLDSHNALILTQLLSQLAKSEGKLIIATIHQPSTLIFQNMDKLYLLKRGQCIYNGPADKIVSYMEELQIQVNYRMNPADFFMLQISQMKQLNGYKTPLTSQAFENKHNLSKNYFIEDSQESFMEQAVVHKKKQPYSIQFKPLLDRSFKNFYRLPSNQLNKLASAILIPFLLGLLYLHIGDQVPAFSDSFQVNFFLKLVAFYFMTLFFVFSFNIYDTTLVFPTQKELVIKEVNSGLYSIPMYYLGRLCAQLPGCIIPVIINGVSIAVATSMDLSFPIFSNYMLITLVMAFEGYIFGMFFGAICRDQDTTAHLLPIALLPIMIFGGLVVNINNIPVYIRWLQYLSPMRHSFLILFQKQMTSSKFKQFETFNIPQLFGMGGDAYIAWICLAMQLIGYAALTIVLLYSIKRKI